MSTDAPYVIDKSDWGSGPWQQEPDKLQWRTKTGLPGLIVRSNPRYGNLCGYAAVNPGHPLYGKGYDEVELDEPPHGDLTFAGACMEDGPVCHIPEPGEPGDVWWFGFDCGHYLDLMPGLRAYERRSGFPADLRYQLESEQTYKDIGYVRREVEGLAAQLAEVRDAH